MTRLNRTAFFVALLSTGLFACGDDDGDNGNGGADASPDTDGGADASVFACSEFSTPAGSISSYPGSFDGDLVGAGADLDVPAGACADERSHFPQVGEDQVVQLTGLTPGAAYVASITAAPDIGFYVATSCEATGPVTGQCLLFVDEAGGSETGDFVAPDSGVVFVTIDQYAEEPPADGSYTLEVFEAECSEDSECTEPGLGVCSNRTCVQCDSPTDCTAEGTPVCDLATNTCVAGFDMCTGDDPSPPENADDGPVGATELSPTVDTPATATANLCSLPAAEADYYTFTLDEAGSRLITLEWDGEETDRDIYVMDSEGTIVAAAETTDNPEFVNAALEPGTYYVAITQYAPADTAAATPYTITVSIPECASSFDCELVTEPVCNPLGECVAGPAECTGDDAVAETAGDDGPAGATDATPLVGETTTITSQICNTPATETDFYQVTVDDGDSLTITATWADAATDLDVYVYDATGTLYGLTFWTTPEVVTVSNLAAGTYYFEVQSYLGNGTPVPAAVDYTVTVDRAAGGCTVDADCDDEFETQIFRGSCDVGTGACNAIEGAGALVEGDACDSPDDCATGMCSNALFQSDAATSTCTVACGSNADCADGYACTTPFQTNFCKPVCAVNTDCGANLGSSTLDTDLPWDYLTCNVAAGGSCDL